MENGNGEIGESLRATRERLGLTLKQAEADTRIRTRYLAALEEERFDELPGEAYARGFLRCYADYLGLDGVTYLAAFRARGLQPEPAMAPTPQSRPPRPRPAPVLVVAIALAAVAALGLGAWKLEDRRGAATAEPAPPHPESVGIAPAPAAEPAPAQPAQPPPAAPAPPPALELTAQGGDCWLDVRIGGPAGARAFVGTLRQGRTMRFGLRRALFIRAGAPEHLHATIGGREQPLRAGDRDLVATPQGLTPRP